MHRFGLDRRVQHRFVASPLVAGLAIAEFGSSHLQGRHLSDASEAGGPGHLLRLLRKARCLPLRVLVGQATAHGRYPAATAVCSSAKNTRFLTYCPRAMARSAAGQSSLP